MSIAEKLVTVAENIPKVYNAGYLKGKSEGGSNGTDYLQYLQSAMFSTAISEITENIDLNVSRMTSVSGLFNTRALNCEKLTIKISDNCSNFMNFMSTNPSYVGTIKEVEIIGNTSKVTTWLGAFNQRKTLEKIIGELDFSNNTNFTNTFVGCSALQLFTPKKETISLSISFSNSPDLLNKSKQAIFDGLAPVETTQTLTLNNQVKILQSQVDSANAKGWTVAGGTVVSEEEYYG